MKTPRILLFVLAAGLFFSACKKKDTQADVVVNIDYGVDALDLQWDSLMYQNAAGNRYSVTTLKYYLSNITFGSSKVDPYASTEVFLIDAAAPAALTLADVPIGTYNSVTATIGIEDARNVTGGLHNTQANNAMAWPDMMGGGYHFMKFEGNYLDSMSVRQGFAIHLGKSGNQATCTFPVNLAVEEGGVALDIRMNLNEWFRNPHTYDFTVDGSSIMTNDAALAKIAANGVDVLR